MSATRAPRGDDRPRRAAGRAGPLLPRQSAGVRRTAPAYDPAARRTIPTLDCSEAITASGRLVCRGGSSLVPDPASSRRSWPRSRGVRRSTRRRRSWHSTRKTCRRRTSGAGRDAFSFVPEPARSVVAAALSRTSREACGGLLGGVDRMLLPGGRVFIFDEAPHGLWHEEAGAEQDVVWRTLRTAGGSASSRCCGADELRALLDSLGWRAEITRRDRSGGDDHTEPGLAR